jgi:hypothetical protein
VKVFASYQIPKVDVGLNVYYRYLTGLPYNSRMRFSGGDRRELGLPLVPSAWRTVLAEPRGSRRLDNQSLLDLRVEKIFRVGNDRLAVYADIANVFNSSVVDDVYTRIDGTTVGTAETGFTDLPFGGPTSVIAPRQITFGARWSF